MKKFIFSLLAMIYALNSSSQTDNDSKKGKFKLGVHFSYDNNLSSNQITFNEYTGYNLDYNEINLNTGLSLEYAISSKLSFVSGANFSEKSFTGTYFCRVCDFITEPLPQKFDLQFLELPVTVKYYFLWSKLYIFGEVGFNNLWNLTDETKFQSEHYILAAKIAGGIEHSFSDRFTLQLKVDYNQNLTRVFQDADYDYKILGVRLGFLVNL